MRPNLNRACWIWPLGALAVWSIGCADDATCDPGQELVNGACRALPAGTASGGTGGTAGAGGLGGSGGVSGAGDAGSAGATSCEVDFGDPCESDDDCGCDAPICATLPGNFLCTNTCDDDPDACPEGFVCEDLSAFGDYPATCFPEGALAF